ncbi:MAG: type II toxin-antitoxin system Phd/YefM family antitoxin [Vicinamibacteria bacterium]
MPESEKDRAPGRELKTRLGTDLREVREGATIIVTQRGKPVVELRPFPTGSENDKGQS